LAGWQGDSPGTQSSKGASMRVEPQYKVGGLVRWSRHKTWDHGGLGFIVARHYNQIVGWKYKIMWHIDLQEIVGYEGMWYDVSDFVNGDIEEV